MIHQAPLHLSRKVRQQDRLVGQQHDGIVKGKRQWRAAQVGGGQQPHSVLSQAVNAVIRRGVLRVGVMAGEKLDTGEHQLHTCPVHMRACVLKKMSGAVCQCQHGERGRRGKWTKGKTHAQTLGIPRANEIMHGLGAVEQVPQLGGADRAPRVELIIVDRLEIIVLAVDAQGGGGESETWVSSRWVRRREEKWR